MGWYCTTIAIAVVYSFGYSHCLAAGKHLHASSAYVVRTYIAIAHAKQVINFLTKKLFTVKEFHWLLKTMKIL